MSQTEKKTEKGMGQTKELERERESERETERDRDRQTDIDQGMRRIPLLPGFFMPELLDFEFGLTQSALNFFLLLAEIHPIATKNSCPSKHIPTY